MNDNNAAKTTLSARWLLDRKIYHYPATSVRHWQLTLAVFATIILYFQLYTIGGVSPLLAVQLHMSFMYLVVMIAITNLIGAFGSLVAGVADRLGRVNMVIWGMLVVGILTGFVVPAMSDKLGLTIMLCIVGFIEGMLLVATPALVRDYSPQVGRAEAMGIWNIGPVAGSLIVAIVATSTLSHFHNTWTSQFRISGITGLVAFVILLLTMKELSPQLRDQLAVNKKDKALIEARATAGFTGDIHKPFKQLLHVDVWGLALGSGGLLLLYFTLVGFGPILYATAFHFSAAQANGIAAWAWGVNVVVSLLVGLLFDWTGVRKPWMIVGGLLTAVFELVLLFRLGHPMSFGALSALMAVMSGSFGVGMIAFYAAFTETVEAHNPALTATGLAIWGWTVRVIAFISFIVTPYVVTSATTLLEGPKAPGFKQAIVAVNGEWRTWLWICIAGAIFFILTAFVAKGPWTRKQAKAQVAEHDRRVASELAELEHVS